MQEPGNRQLYALMHNSRLQASIRQRARALWELRDISAEEELKIATHYRSMFLPPLKKWYIPLAVLFPFVCWIFPVQALISARLLREADRKSWRTYWTAIGAGCILWFIATLITGLYILK